MLNISRINRAALHLNGNLLAGTIDEAVLPSIERMTTELKRLTTIGKQSASGMFGEMRIKMKGTFEPVLAKMAVKGDQEKGLFQIRCNKATEGTTGIESEVPLVFFCRAYVQKADPLTAKGVDESGDANYDLVCDAYQCIEDGYKHWDIDLLQFKAEVDGEDIFQTSNSNIGV